MNTEKIRTWIAVGHRFVGWCLKLGHLAFVWHDLNASFLQICRWMSGILWLKPQCGGSLNTFPRKGWLEHIGKWNFLWINLFSCKCLIRPHRGSFRKILDRQKIHSSVILAVKSSHDPYIPNASPSEDGHSFWNMALKEGLGHWLEPDLYENIDKFANNFVQNPEDGSVNLPQAVLQSKSIIFLILIMAHSSFYIKL